MTPVLLSLALSATPLARRTDPDWYRGEVFYQIYVRSFLDSNADGHGDLRGLISKLDVLGDLGVTALWLMPIFEGPSLHGYSVSNHDQVEADYGTMEDARALFEAAHAKDMAVILDYVPNHVSSEHPWLRDPARAVWLEPGRPYHAFTPDMPDLNLRDVATRRDILAVTDRWIDRGADGFRVDAIRHLYENGPERRIDQDETFTFVADLRKRLDAKNAMMVVEAWAERSIAARYGIAGAHLVFDFDRAYALHRALDTGDASTLESAVRESERAGIAWGTFVTNHDCPVPRAASFGRGAAASANAVVLLGGGVPFLYQGDELGMRGIDEDQVRRPYKWTAEPSAGFTTGKPWRPIGARDEGDHLFAQMKDPRSVWSRTRDLIALRKKFPSLVFGTRKPLGSKSRSIWSFVRELGEERVVVRINLAEPYDVSVEPIIAEPGSHPSPRGSNDPTRPRGAPTRSGPKSPTAR